MRPEDISSIIGGLGEGTQRGLASTAEYAGSRREAAEVKRRTLANLLSRIMKRNQGLFKAGQEFSGGMGEYQSNLMQSLAKTFADTLRGSKGR